MVPLERLWKFKSQIMRKQIEWRDCHITHLRRSLGPEVSFEF
jgi:hypothetical protein